MILADYNTKIKTVKMLPMRRLRLLRVTNQEDVAFEYTAPGGGSVKVPRIIRLHEELQIAQDASRDELKRAYMKAARHYQRQTRVMGIIIVYDSYV